MEIDWPRPPLPARERRRGRIVGLLAGALIGAGTAFLVVGLGNWAVALGVAAVLGFFVALLFPSLTAAPSALELLLEPSQLWPIVLGLLLGPLGWLVSALGLRRRGLRRALGVTAAAGVLPWLAGMVGGCGTLAAVVWLDAELDVSSDRTMLLAAGGAGAAFGALAGWGGWAWMGHLTRPRGRASGWPGAPPSSGAR